MGVLHPGQLLAESYRVIREIGAGGMGVVYEIEHVRLRKRYVAKVIHEQISGEEGAAKRMEREAQVLAGISHRNIVQVHDVGTTREGLSYFVMERLDGLDLRSLMKRQVVQRLRAIDIITDVLDALDYVHRRGLVHRDIKPENIFLSEEATGTVTKVLDFGIVHIFDGDGRISQNRITKTGGFVGTLYYAAPEQMQGKASAPPNDVYAAGLVLFELLAGRGPFDDDPGVGLSRCFKPAPLLTDVAPREPRELSAVLAKALEQDPARRPHAAALAAELRAVATTLRTQPGVAEEDALRAEIDDLLRRMPPVDLTPRQHPRKPTPQNEEPFLDVARKAASRPVPAGFDTTMRSAGEQGGPPPQHVSIALAPTAHAPTGQSPIFVATLPLDSARHPTPARPRPLETSPGLYATVDHPPGIPPPSTNNRWRGAAVVSVVFLGASLVTAGMILRSTSTSDDKALSAASAMKPLEAPAASASVLAPSASASTAPSASASASVHR